MRDVLVHVRNLAQWGHVASYATDIAAHVNGTLTALYVEPSAIPAAMPAAGAEIAIVGRKIASEDSVRSARAAEGLAAWAVAMGARQASWQIVTGEVPQALARASTSHDLLVLDRDPDQPLASVRDLGEIVVSSRAPIILVPPRRREAPLDCIALAWNHSEESLAAIHAARPLLAHATRIVLLEGGKSEERADQSWFPHFDIGRYLTWQGFRAERDAIRGESSEAGEMLVHAARRHRADLLVMGAYGRSRLSEWALGGATRSVLMDASLPVFLKH